MLKLIFRVPTGTGILDTNNTAAKSNFLDPRYKKLFLASKPMQKKLPNGL